MKKWVFTLMIAACFSMQSFAQGFAEDFRYATNDSMIGKSNPGNVAWSQYTHAGAVIWDFSARDSILSFPGYPSSGNALYLRYASTTISPDATTNLGKSMRIQYPVGSPLIIPAADVTDRTVYVSFLYRVSSASPNAYYNILSMSYTAPSRARVLGRRGITGTGGAGTADLSFDLNSASSLPGTPSNTNNLATTPGSLKTYNTYLIVVKYRRMGTGVNDIMNLFILRASDGIPSTEPVTPNVSYSGDATKTVIDGITLFQPRSGNAGDGIVGGIALLDGIKASTTWAGLFSNATSWNGTTWTNGAPSQTVDAVIDNGTSPGSFTARTVTISSGTSLTLNNTDIATAYRGITNNGNGITGTGNVVVAATDTLYGNALSYGGVLSISNNAVLTTNNKLTLISNATSTGMVGSSTGSIAGNVTIERYVPAGKRAFRFLSSPVSATASIHANWQENATTATNDPKPGYGTHITGSTIDQQNGFDATATGNPSLFTFNNTSQAWIAASNTDAATLTAGVAYRILVRGDRSSSLSVPSPTSTAATLRSTGTIVSGTVTLGTANSTPSSMPLLSSAADGFSFIGNPYASSMNWATIGRAGITGYYYLWDPNLATRGAYVAVFTDGSKSNLSSAATVNIQPGQAFFVQNTSINETRQLTITETDKSTSNNNAVFRNASSPKVSMQLFLQQNLASGISQDGACIYFDANANASIDGMDARKMTNLDENIAIEKAGQLVSIEERPFPLSTEVVALKLWQLPTASNYVLRMDAAGLPTGLLAFLKDNLLGTETALNLSSSTDYAFTASSASADANRFQIIFRSNAALPVHFSGIKAFQNGSNVSIQWNAAPQNETDSFEVEKSTDGNAFQPIQTVKPTVSANYSAIDASPLQGNNFYRIKAISKSGEVNYSSIVNVKIGKSKNVFVVVGNPVKNGKLVLQAEGAEKAIYNISIVSVSGQKLMFALFNHQGGSATQSMNVSSLACGQYYLKVEGNNIKATQKIIIQ